MEDVIRRKQTNKIYRTNKRITIVSLVVTVIIMLILAGVTISVTVGENGTVKKMKNELNTVQDKQEKIDQEINTLSGQLSH